MPTNCANTSAIAEVSRRLMCEVRVLHVGSRPRNGCQLGPDLVVLALCLGRFCSWEDLAFVFLFVIFVSW